MTKIAPKKHFGQNFLTSTQAIGKIIEAGKIEERDTVLEIGPGKGALTKELLFSGASVVAVETDAELVEFLTEKFSEEIRDGKLILVSGDILEITDQQINDLCPNGYKLIANIPYYITGAIIEKFLSSSYQPKMAVLLTQREVAERIVRKDKNGGNTGAGSILSEAVWIYGAPKYIHTVKAGSFFPAPKVDSAILSISDISRQNFSNDQKLERKFFEVLKSGFAHKRKKLLSNLAKAKIADKKDLQKIFSKMPLNEKIRAEKLTNSNWLELAKNLVN